MRKLFVLIIIFTFSFSSFSLAEEVDSSDETKESGSIFKLPEHKGIKENMKAFNLEEMTAKSKEVGEKAYLFLQSNSVLYLLICLGIGLVFLIVGIVIKFFRALAGFAILVGILGFTLINFAPDAVNRFVAWVSNFVAGYE